MNVGALRTVAQICEESRGAVTEPQLRAWVFARRNNGLDRAIIRLGGGRGRIYFDIDAFGEWLESRRESNGSRR